MIKDLKIIEILKEIKNNTKTNDKIKIIQDNQDLLKDVLIYLFNNQPIGISSKKVNKKININNYQYEELNCFEEAISYLTTNNTGKDKDIIAIKKLIEKYPETISKIVEEIIIKSFKLGIAITSINKAYGYELIEDFNVMKGEKYFDNMDLVQDKKFILTKKLDGNRMFCIKENDTILFRTAEGNYYDGLIEIENDIKLLPDGCYDGEIIAKNDKKLKSKDLFRLTQSILRKKGIKTGLEFHMFDMITISEYKNKKGVINAFNRKDLLHNLLEKIDLKLYSHTLKEVPILYKGDNINMINFHLDKVLNDEDEGLILNFDKPYEFKRTKNLLKIKVMESYDLRIIGFKEGQGENKGKLGDLIVDYKGNQVGVGSGFSKKQRSDFWNNQDEYLNRIAEIQHFGESSNKKGGKSLRHTRFKCLREIGKEVSYN